MLEVASLVWILGIFSVGVFELPWWVLIPGVVAGVALTGFYDHEIALPPLNAETGELNGARLVFEMAISNALVVIALYGFGRAASLAF